MEETQTKSNLSPRSPQSWWRQTLGALQGKVLAELTLQSSENSGCSGVLLQLPKGTRGLCPELNEGNWAVTKKKGTWLILPFDQHCERKDTSIKPKAISKAFLFAQEVLGNHRWFLSSCWERSQVTEHHTSSKAAMCPASQHWKDERAGVLCMMLDSSVRLNWLWLIGFIAFAFIMYVFCSWL